MTDENPDETVHIVAAPDVQQGVAQRLLAGAGDRPEVVKTTSEGFEVPRWVFDAARFLPSPPAPGVEVDEDQVPTPGKVASPEAQAAADDAEAAAGEATLDPQGPRTTHEQEALPSTDRPARKGTAPTQRRKA